MRNKGFTLIEVIIVIVILGILAGLALPRIARQAEAARAAEAINILGSLKRAAMDCLDIRGDTTFTNCDTQADLGVTIPSTANGAKFTYTQSGSASATMQLIATRNSQCIGIQLAISTTNGTLTTTYGASGNVNTNPYYSSFLKSSGNTTFGFTPTCGGTAI